MAVDSPSRDYELVHPHWVQCRDCYAGSHVVKGKGTTYLPKLAGHDPGDRTDPYWSYVDRALYYNAYGRTIDGLVGMVLRRDPRIEIPEGADARRLIDDFDGEGRSITDLAYVTLTEGLTTGRRGLLVDYTRDLATPEARPYVMLYAAEQILDTVYDTDLAGQRRLVQVRLRERVERPDPDDEFESSIEERVRVLELYDPTPEITTAVGLPEQRTTYRQRLFVLVEGDDQVPDAWEERDAVVPLLDGAPLDFIPFWPIGTGSGLVSGEIEMPPLLDLSDVNLSHYRTMADIENAAHIAGVPTMFISGAAADATIRLGSFEAQLLPEADAKAYFVSYGGEGLTAIERRAAAKEQMMAFLGARMLQPDKRAVEATETAQIHRQGEVSVLATLANHQSAQFTKALRFMLAWAGFDGAETAIFKLNTDYWPMKANPQLLAEMRNTWTIGGISYETFWQFMVDGELAPALRTHEDERALIEAEQEERAAQMPLPLPPGTPGGPGTPGPASPFPVGRDVAQKLPPAAAAA